MIKQSIFLLIFLLTTLTAYAQEDSTWKQKPRVKLLAFADVFYVYDFSQPQTSVRQAYLYSHNRHNEVNLNLGLFKMNVSHEKYRANLALQTGTFANDNNVAEPGVLKGVYEANVGVSLNKKNNLWLDAGVLPSHIGFESAISMDNMTLTRSLLAENTPYYLSGAKLTLSPNDKLELAAMVLNGWQRIQRVQSNSMLSYATQLVFKPSDKVSLNWSTFIGTDDPDSTRRVRYFNNLYGAFQLSEKFSFFAGVDYGIQQKVKGAASYDCWLTPVLIGQYKMSEQWKTALRLEYFQDNAGVIIPTGTTNGFQTTGLSLNVDYLPNENVVCRIEGRWLSSKDAIFENPNSMSNTNFSIAASIAVKVEACFKQKNDD